MSGNEEQDILNTLDTLAHICRARTYAQGGDFKQALVDLEQAMDLNPIDSVTRQIIHGFKHFEKGDYGRAINDLEAAMQIDPNYPSLKQVLEKARVLYELGNSAMFEAIMDRRLDDITTLVEQVVVAVNQKNKNGEPYIVFAAKSGIWDVVKHLKELGADIDARCDKDSSAMDYAIYSENAENIKLLHKLGADLEAKNSYGGTPIFSCVYNDKIESLKCLKKLGANIEARNNSGQTPLFAAVVVTGIVTTIDSDRTKVIQCLADLGADVNAKDELGMSPIFKAVIAGHIECMKLLVDLGANINVKHENGMTLIDLAVAAGQTKATEWLRLNSGNTNAKNYSEKARQTVDTRGNTGQHAASYADDYVERGLSYLKNGERERAIKEFEAAMRINPGYPGLKEYLENAKMEQIKQSTAKNGQQNNYDTKANKTGKTIVIIIGCLIGVSLLFLMWNKMNKHTNSPDADFTEASPVSTPTSTSTSTSVSTSTPPSSPVLSANVALNWKTALNKVKNYDKTDDNGVYRGQLNYGVREGWGLYRWTGERTDGDYYIGKFSDDKRNDLGIHVVKLDGNPIANSPGCFVYAGGYSQNLKSGHGACYDRYGNLIYYGYFSNNKPTDIYPSANERTGRKFVTTTYNDGNTYIGEMQNGQRKGQGILVSPHGNAWYGIWDNDKRNGEGIFLGDNGTWERQRCSNGDCAGVR